MSTVYVCRKCHQPRRADEVLEITNLRTDAVTHVCRPSSSQRCFANDVFTRDEERIAAVTDDEPRDAA